MGYYGTMVQQALWLLCGSTIPFYGITGLPRILTPTRPASQASSTPACLRCASEQWSSSVAGVPLPCCPLGLFLPCTFFHPTPCRSTGMECLCVEALPKHRLAYSRVPTVRSYLRLCDAGHCTGDQLSWHARSHRLGRPFCQSKTAPGPRQTACAPPS
jgi:hypothetical protein